MNWRHLVRASLVASSPSAVLQSSTSQLLGCDEEMAAVLAELQIHTIYDLAMSSLFNAAMLITDQTSMIARLGFVTAELVSDGPSPMPLSKMRGASIELLDGIGPAHAARIRSCLRVATVEQLSSWGPFRAAHQILQETLGQLPPVVGKGVGEDETPPELVPTAGEHATEKRHYSKVFIDEGSIKVGRATEFDGLLDLGDLIDGSLVFESPAFGAVLTFEQTWTPYALSLGQLLHSLALAPGESTRIAIIDWSRQSTASLSETSEQLEELAHGLTQNRAIEEVASGTVREVQEGNSRITTSASTMEAGGSHGLPLIFAGSFGTSSSDSDSIAVSSSSGARDVTADSLQEIAAATNQNASSARTRRASIVRETRQEEHEKLQTRLVANYNHSHAMSVHYYEVVQMYRVQVRRSACTRCVFLPMKPLDFGDPRIYQQFKHVLQPAVKNSPLGRMMAREQRIALQEPDQPPATFHHVAAQALGQKAAGIIYDEKNGSTLLPVDSEVLGILVAGDLEKWGLHAPLVRVTLHRGAGVEPIVVEAGQGLWPTSPNLPVDVADITSVTYQLLRLQGTSDVVETLLENSNDDYDEMVVHIVLTLRNSRGKSLVQFATETISWASYVDHLGHEREFRLFDTEVPEGADTILDVLQENALAYSRLIWRNLDQQSVALLLSGKTLNGVPLIEMTDPQPVTVFGNYIVLRYYGEDKGWLAWQNKHARPHPPQEDQVALPTGGVFAEAVLGRSNASEKLDITRFWNWQDSPIPHMAPEIAPLQAGSRSESEELNSPRFDAPIVNVMNPPSMPDPQGMSGVLGLLAASNIFRDMSGLAQAATLAQQGIVTTGAGAAHGAEMALATLKELNAAATEAAKMFVGGGALGGGSKVGPNNPSYTGAMINQAAKLDQRQATGVVGKTPGSSSNGGSVQGGSSGGNSSGGGAQTGGQTTTLEARATESAIGLAPSNSQSNSQTQQNYEAESGPMLAGLHYVDDPSSDFYLEWVLEPKSAHNAKAYHARDIGALNRMLADLDVSYPLEFKEMWRANHLAYGNFFHQTGAPAKALFEAAESAYAADPSKGDFQSFLDSDGKKVLQGLIALLVEQVAPVTVEGHAVVTGMASMSGTSKVNDIFASRRASVTDNALVQAIDKALASSALNPNASTLLGGMRMSRHLKHLGNVSTKTMLGFLDENGKAPKNDPNWRRSTIIVRQLTTKELLSRWEAYVLAWANRDRDSKSEIHAWIVEFDGPIVKAVVGAMNLPIGTMFPGKAIADHKVPDVSGFDAETFSYIVWVELMPNGQADFWMSLFETSSSLAAAFYNYLRDGLLPALKAGRIAFLNAKSAFDEAAPSTNATVREFQLKHLERASDSFNAAIARTEKVLLDYKDISSFNLHPDGFDHLKTGDNK